MFCMFGWVVLVCAGAVSAFYVDFDFSSNSSLMNLHPRFSGGL
jgi:hypothetical protein